MGGEIAHMVFRFERRGSRDMEKLTHIKKRKKCMELQFTALQKLYVGFCAKKRTLALD